MISQFVTKEMFLASLAGTKLAHRLDDLGNFVILLEADDVFPHRITVTFTVKMPLFCFSEAKVSFIATTLGMNIPEDGLAAAMMFCNDWNSSRGVPQVSVLLEQGELRARYSMRSDVHVSCTDVLPRIPSPLSLGLADSIICGVLAGRKETDVVIGFIREQMIAVSIYRSKEFFITAAKEINTSQQEANA